MATDYARLIRTLVSEHFAREIAEAGHEETCSIEALAGDEPDPLAVCDCVVGVAGDLLALAEWYRKTTRQLLVNISGGPQDCRGCGRPVYWVAHKNGRATPYDESGLNHFASCPKAGSFR